MATLDLNTIGQLWFDSSAEALVVVDNRGTIAAANRRAVDLFGYTLEEFNGMSVESLIPERFRGNHVGHRERYVNRPEQRSMGIGLDLVALTNTGREVPVEISMNHLQIDGAGYTLALVSDISRRKAIERELHEVNATLEQRIDDATRELRESQKLHEVIARKFPNGTINVLDRDLNYVFVEGKELFNMGVPSSRLIGTRYIDRLSVDIQTHAEEFFEQVFDGQAQTFEVFHLGQYYQLDAVPLENNAGVVDRLLVVEHNISSQKESERQMRESLKREKELGELKSRFVSMASHEFRTPLTSVLSSASILEKYLKLDEGNALNPKREKHVHRIRQAVSHLNNILNDFLSLDKLESGATDVNLEAFSVAELFQDMLHDFEGMTAREDRIELVLDVPEDEVVTDARIVRNICVNLLSNALKYSPEDTVVTLAAKTSANTLEVSVIDRGMGIPEEEQKHLFERFFRAGNVTNIQGTGLGLNIVRRYLDLLEGDIDYTSLQGQGTTFTFTIPLHANPTAS